MFRSDEMEGTPVAEKLARRGYQSFVVNYRFTPYIQKEGTMDLARGVRFTGIFLPMSMRWRQQECG